MITTLIAMTAWWQASPARARVPYQPMIVASVAAPKTVELPPPPVEEKPFPSLSQIVSEIMATRQSKPDVPPPPVIGNSEVIAPAQTTTTTSTTTSTTTTTTTEIRRIPSPRDLPVLAPDPMRKEVSVQVQDMDVATVLSTLCEQIGINLVLQSPSDKKLTLNLSNTPFRDILTTICSLSDLYFVETPSMVIVGSKDALVARYADAFYKAYPQFRPADNGAIVSRTVKLDYVDAVAVAQVLREQWKEEDLSVSVGPSHWTPELMEASSGSVTGINGAANSRPPAAAGGGGTGPTGDPASKVVVLRGSQTVIDQALELVKTMDYARPQVVIKVQILDISNDALQNLGLKWDFGSTGFTENTPPGIGVMPFQRQGFNFQAQIAALIENGAGRVLAEPNVSVLDGRRGFVLIGDRLRYPVATGLDANGRPIFTTEEQPVGIYLQVAPTVAADNTVSMSIYPQVSAVTDFLDVPNVGRFPQISTRETQSSISVKSGQTIVIGGLIQEQDIKKWQEVPVLSRIPFFGELFKWRSTTKTSSQVVISITPTVVRPEDNQPE